MLYKTILLVVLITLLTSSCKKNDEHVNSKLDAVDIYMAGYEFSSGLAVATYWKNGKAIHLTDGMQWAEAHAIVVSGNDVYVAGVERNTAMYWKNGTPHVLANQIRNFPGLANSIAISGNDVFISGTEQGIFPGYPGTNVTQKVGKYWKNGTLMYLSSEFFSSEASSITVSGNDVYIAGNAWEPYSLDSIGTICNNCQRYEKATYWKNGVPVYLTDGTTSQAHATGIAVSGSDIYVCGNILYDASTTSSNKAAYWKNGSMVTLIYSGADRIQTTGIVVSGNDVYVSGTGYVNNGFSKALYWKNGVGIPLQGIGQQVSGTANAIALNGNDVYIAGNLFYITPDPAAMQAIKCWKNNNMLTIPIDITKRPFVKSIYLVNK